MVNRKLIYIGDHGSAVFQSQVFGLLEEINRKLYFNRVVLLVGIKSDDDWNKEIEVLEQNNVEVIVFKRFPNYSIYFNKQLNELNNIIKGVLSDNTILHIRGESLSVIVKKIVNRLNYSNIRILTDVRGASYEETKLYNKVHPVLYPLKLQQHYKNIKLLYKNTDAVSCVSEKLKQYLIDRSEIDKSRVSVNHCIAGVDFAFSKKRRKSYREKLNLSDKDILFLFVTGGDKKWQNTDEIISNIVSHGYKVLNMSKSKIHKENVINLFVPYEDVPNYLNAADISIVWRNNDIVNNVASPVKFSEYVCSGLPVIANNGVDVINKYIENTGYGVTIADFNELNDNIVNKLILLDRDEISKYSKQCFGSEKISDDYMSIYKYLLGKIDFYEK